MTAHEFSSCSNILQFEILKQAGVCLATCQSDSVLSYLFSIDTFYVEVVQDRSSGQDFNLRSFDDVDELDPYLSQIDISTMLNS
jgi:hypothetical protein